MYGFDDDDDGCMHAAETIIILCLQLLLTSFTVCNQGICRVTEKDLRPGIETRRSSWLGQAARLAGLGLAVQLASQPSPDR